LSFLSSNLLPVFSMFRPIILMLSVFLMLSFPALAQTSVAVRTGKHSGYTRAVFDWNSPVSYNVRQQNSGEILVDFQKSADMSLSVHEHGAGTDILDVKQVSSSGANLQVVLKTPPERNFRHFMVGNRVVVDVLAPLDNKESTTSSPDSSPVTVKTPKPEKQEKELEKEFVKTGSVKDPVADLVVKPDAEKLPSMKAESVEEQILPPEKTILEQAASVMPPHVITVSSTEAMGLAAFRRSDWLWIVMDRSTLPVTPQISGEQAGKFTPFQRMEIKGGVAFRTKLPPETLNMHVYGEGGGLIWRILVTPNERSAKPVEMQRQSSNETAARDGKIVWPLTAVTKILEVPDPSVGDMIKVVTMEQAGQFGGMWRSLVDFDMLESVIGLAIIPKADDLEIKKTSETVEIMRPSGLAFSRSKDINRRLIRTEVQEVTVADEPAEPGKEIRRIFDFDRWMMGGLKALEENQRILLSGMAVKDKEGRVQDLLTLAKMNVSNDRGQEALGFLSYAAEELPAIADNPEFRALKGASAALAGKHEIAFHELWHPVLMEYTELDYWRAYTLAMLEDWQQAVEMMPRDFTVLMGYPRPLLEKIGLKLAEIALRSGDGTTAGKVLAVLEKERASLKSWTRAGLDYLQGEVHRQKGEFDQARQLWSDLSSGHDDLYRAKGGLALTMLELQHGDITLEQAIDRLEGLRYLWRGDELEARINYMLGKFYLEQDKYLKGLSILRDAITMSPESDVGKEVAVYMRESFRDLLLRDEDLDPLDAVQVYEEFRELTPTGEEGNRLIQKLAERLVLADLLERATKILEHQVDFRLSGEDKARVAIRLGAIDLIDKNPRPAMKYLAIGRDLYNDLLSGKAREDKLREIDLLRARGLSQLNRTEEALDMLHGFDPAPDVNRLRVDIAWKAGLWEDAAEALQDLILDEALDMGRPLTPAQADLILNNAVALNLAGNRVALNNARRRYEDAMKKTARARLFDVVTRPRKTTIMADRETIESIVQEVDMFKDFLESYRTDAQAVSN